MAVFQLARSRLGRQLNDHVTGREEPPVAGLERWIL